MDTTSPVIAPIIHLNGDRPETLTAALQAAYTALGTAILALHECSPNGRNFYPEPGLFEQARAQHLAKVEALKTVRASLIAEHDAIDAQRAPRRASLGAVMQVCQWCGQVDIIPSEHRCNPNRQRDV